MDDENRRLRYVLFLIAGSGLIAIARAMSLTFVAIKLQQSFGLNPAAIGAILGVGPLLGAITAPFAGSFSDKAGRKSVLAITLLSMAIALVGMGIAQSVMAFCLAQVVSAVAIAVYEPISRALMSDVCPERLRLKYFSWRYTASNVGWAIGPLIGAAAGAASGKLFIASGLVYAAIALAVHFRPVPIARTTGGDTPREGVSLLNSIKAAALDPRLAFFIGGGTLLIALYGQWSATIGTYLAGNVKDGVQIYAYLSSINGAVVLLGNPFARRFIERAGALPALVAGCLFFLVSEISFLHATAFIGFAISMVIFTLGEILVVPSEYLLIDRISTAHNRGSYFGAHSFSTIGNSLGPMLGGLMLFAYGGVGMFSLFAVFAAASATFFIIGTRMPPPRLRRDDRSAQLEDRPRDTLSVDFGVQTAFRGTAR
jgi:MFS family permease